MSSSRHRTYPFDQNVETGEVLKTEAERSPTPYRAALLDVGMGSTTRIERYHLDGGRCGLVQGRHAAWNWAYRVHTPKAVIDVGRGLESARRFAACYFRMGPRDLAGGEALSGAVRKAAYDFGAAGAIHERGSP